MIFEYKVEKSIPMSMSMTSSKLLYTIMITMSSPNQKKNTKSLENSRKKSPHLLSEFSLTVGVGSKSASSNVASGSARATTFSVAAPRLLPDMGRSKRPETNLGSRLMERSFSKFWWPILIIFHPSSSTVMISEEWLLFSILFEGVPYVDPFLSWCGWPFAFIDPNRSRVQRNGMGNDSRIVGFVLPSYDSVNCIKIHAYPSLLIGISFQATTVK